MSFLNKLLHKKEKKEVKEIAKEEDGAKEANSTKLEKNNISLYRLAKTKLGPVKEETKNKVARTAETVKKKDDLMSRFFNESKNPPSSGDLVEGNVINIDKDGVYVDLSPFATGLIFGREYINAREIIRKINIGDRIAAKVVDAENEDGYIELSLKEARQAIVWSEAEAAIKNKTIFELTIKEANKGGLIMEWQGIQGFLPASQLKTEHYPRVADGDKDKIYEELKKLIGQKISVSVISVMPKESKLIFSEKNPEQKDKEKIIERYVVGDELDGQVTGIVDFGIFVKIEDGLEGLVHISEIAWSLVEDPKQLFKVNDRVRVKIIEIKDGKISLSIKALKANPWKDASKKYKKDDIVSAVIIKYNRHGALASVEEGVAGLVHISEFGGSEKLREKLELGKTYTFKITIFDTVEQKMALSYLQDKK